MYIIGEHYIHHMCDMYDRHIIYIYIYNMRHHEIILIKMTKLAML